MYFSGWHNVSKVVVNPSDTNEIHESLTIVTLRDRKNCKTTMLTGHLH